MMKNKLERERIFVVIPYYNASAHIANVVRNLPDFIDSVVIVDDKSPQSLPEDAVRLALKSTTQLHILEGAVNLGVGGATKRGFQFAIDKGATIVVKMDADDQMDAKYLPELLAPIVSKKAEMAKGNRFRDIKSLKKMPFIRRSGNLGLSFLTKMATGYWNNFDPTNGYLAIRTDILKLIDFEKLSDRYFFETSILAQMYFVRARVKDVAMPAIYGDEKSSMKVWAMPVVFSFRLLKIFIKRIIKEYFLYDFNIASVYLICGLPLFAFGIIFGIFEWIYYSSQDIGAPTGTIMIVALSIILGFQLLLQAIQYDIFNAPKPKE